MHAGSLKNPNQARVPACLLIDTVYRLLVDHLPEASHLLEAMQYGLPARHIFLSSIRICGRVD